MRTSPYNKESRKQSVPHASAKQRSRDDRVGSDSSSFTSSVPRVFQIVTQQGNNESECSCDFVQCLLVRDVTSGPRERYRLSFQLSSLDGGTAVVPAMVAQKENSVGGHYNLFDLSRAGPEAALTKKAGHFIGKLRQDLAVGSKRLRIFPSKDHASSPTSTVSYTLFNSNEGKDKLGVFIYDAPGLITQWRDGQPPRKLRAILADNCNSRCDAAVLPDNWTEQLDPTTLSITHGTGSADADAAASDPSIVELKTKEPFFDAGQYRLNFRGRVTVPSVKNFQLGDDDRNVLLQFRRVSDHKFHLDYRRPFCAATAFAAALTQFDI